MLGLRRLLRPVKRGFSGEHNDSITLAERLCNDAELDFTEVFRQQFRIRPGKGKALLGFSHIEIGDWALDHGPGLPVAIASFAGGAGHVAFMGIGVDTNGSVVDTQTLSSLVARMRNADAVAEVLTACAGRYAFIVAQGSTQRLYLDPTGSLGAVYDPQNKQIASTVNLVLHRDVVANQTYPLSEDATSGNARFAFGHTQDQHVARLLPNHYLNLTDFRQIRHWPGPMDLDEPTNTAQADLVANIVTRLEQVITALANYSEHTYLALSGGVDSRVMLACSKPALDKLTLMSYVESRMGRKDANIARKLAGTLGHDLTVLDPRVEEKLQITDTDQIDNLGAAYRIATSARGISKEGHEIASAMQNGGLVLQGNVAGFLKAVLWRKAVREYQRGRPHDTGLGIKMMMLGDGNLSGDTAIRMEYEGWYSSLPVLAAKRPYDFMMSEQFLSHGLGNHLYGKRYNFHISPFNDRSMIAAATSLPPDQRARLDYTDAIIEWRAPELVNLPYTRRSVNQQRTTKQEQGVAALKIA